ncbi:MULTISPECIES: DUF262 domain-containing protein [unclassified Oceanispirochaeta]|uniref:DUF262 domain-containing protein n=1 Tax=unclassified Oceanispirochaeta TaxID=2635722 RepID=UPI000E08DBC6|nr:MULTISPECIES: DUF262 domain-containing protein [unclassified Oceanispirochaeta]MBF9015164.1 DUF262 domain-containing protein [Oceanispirochaeta sp. M2]NPD71622.1 DUF262 domain-containing protein [Oceanispirochaeta sp. M1]RDG33188.1 DUF262 domain-containing protein [Oceanispirochaeta sp. M1]
MSNCVTLKSISELLGESFYVPEYQRGYRWTESQISDLLDDIHSFAVKDKKSKKEFYCLQPIIVKSHLTEEDQTVYEIIDGQQRLTTIHILLSYLIKKHLHNEPLEEAYEKTLYTISYKTRPDSAAFLKDIDSDAEEDFIDYYYFKNCYKYIETWFDEPGRKRDAREAVIQTLVNSEENQKSFGVVKVIWYELNDNTTNPIETFIRVNLGKISLTNAELIKALFLQERNFGEGDLARLKQLEIANKWDRIENELQDENFWWFLNKSENKKPSHIEYLFDMICDEDDSIPERVIGNDEHRTFRYYAHRFGKDPDHSRIKALWKEIEERYDALKEWYTTPEWYHYIGFLIYCGKSVSSIMECLNDKTIQTKQDVTLKLIQKISEEFIRVKWTGKDKEPHLDLSFESGSDILRKFYLLFNLEYLNQQCLNGNLISYFPFKAFKIGKHKGGVSWDIEHISSLTENNLEKRNDQTEWLNTVLMDLICPDNEILDEIEDFKNDENSRKFNYLYTKIVNFSEENKIDEELKNSIGNLTLLDAGTNRGYGNALFTSKRRIIIEKDKDGELIPLCTKNVFLKYFDGNVQPKWISEDIKAYRKILENTMVKFIPVGESI